MKRMFIVLILLFVPLLSACRSIPEKTPNLYVSFNTGNSPRQRFQAGQLSRNWNPMTFDRQGNQVGGYCASALHALDSWEWGDYREETIVSLDGISGEVRLRFSNNFPPHTLYVRRWRTEFIGMGLYVKDQYEPIELENNIFRVNDNGYDYIYEVDAKWEQGRSSYTFRINSGK